MIYEYKCPECGEKKEIEMSLDDYAKDDVFCSECFTPMERIYSASILPGALNGGNIPK